MAKPKLSYFDAPVSRGEECRLALVVAGVDFEDDRVRDWPARKAAMPFGAMPVLEMPGHPPLGQSNAILVLVGRLHGLHPEDPFEAGRHEAILEYAEELRHKASPAVKMSDELKKTTRESFASTYVPAWGANVERQIAGPFFGGAAIHVVDCKLFMIVRFLRGGALDHVPTTVLDPFPKLLALHDAVRDHARVREWYAKSNAAS